VIDDPDGLVGELKKALSGDRSDDEDGPIKSASGG